MRAPQTDPAVSRRLAMARYARLHSEAAAARHFGCCWSTIDAAVKRVAAYERSGDIGELQNQPRGEAVPARHLAGPSRIPFRPQS